MKSDFHVISLSNAGTILDFPWQENPVTRPLFNLPLHQHSHASWKSKPTTKMKALLGALLKLLTEWALRCRYVYEYIILVYIYNLIIYLFACILNHKCKCIYIGLQAGWHPKNHTRCLLQQLVHCRWTTRTLEMGTWWWDMYLHGNLRIHCHARQERKPYYKTIWWFQPI